LFLLAIAAVAVVVLAAPSAAGPHKGVANSKTFPDPAGDSGAVPDITQVTISNDNAGLLTFAVAIGNRTELAAEEFVQMYLDTDANHETGDRNGMDYAVQMGASAGPGIFARWTGAGTGFGGSGYTTIQNSGTFTASWTALPRFIVSQTELGDTTHFSFFARTARGSTPDLDDAPDGEDLWEYTLDIPLLFKSLALVPNVPRAGKVFRARMGVRTNTSQQQPVRCQARVGGKPLRGRGSWFSIVIVQPQPGPIQVATDLRAILTCEWQVPRNARGKRLSGSISATNDGVTVTRALSSRVR